MTPTRPSRRRPRRGAILLVVLVLLALFAVVGLSFVLYSESSATDARIHREALNKTGDPNPDDAAAGFLRQLLYPNDPRVNPNDYLLSAMTGHELGRLMYGHNLQEPNDVPYNGHGLFHEQLGVPLIGGPAALAIDRADVVNHTLYRYDPLDPNTWLVIDPEYTRGVPFNSTNSPANRTVRLGTTDVLNSGLLTESASSSNPNPFNYVGKNAPYTYPDRNNLAVALVNPTTGQVIVPSFHRPTLFRHSSQTNPNESDLAQTNPNWFLPSGRFKLVRPRPFDHLTAADIQQIQSQLGANALRLADNPAAVSAQLVQRVNQASKFPYPPMNPDGTITGDVQNLRYADGRQRNDSVWLDLNLPTFKGPSGGWKQYPKGIAPLVAAIVLPLDGRVNLNVAGNLRLPPNLTEPLTGPFRHTSNQGFGPHEINPAKVLVNTYNGTPLPADRWNIDPIQLGQYLAGNRYEGTSTTNNNVRVPTWPGTPGLRTKLFQPDPTAPVAPGGEVLPPTYAGVDFAGTAGAGSFALPAGFASQPTYTGYYAPSVPPGNVPDQAQNQPLMFNPYTRTQFPLNPANNVPGLFPTADLRRMSGRYSDRAETLRVNYLPDKFPIAFGSQTPPSLAAPGTSATGPGMPGNVTRALTTPYSNHLNRPGLAPNYLTYKYLPADTVKYIYDPTTPWPKLDKLPEFNLNLAPTPNPTSDLTTTNAVRNQRAGLSAIDLNRPLADYRVDKTKPLAALVGSSGNQKNVDPNSTQFAQAQADRQAFARDIFQRLAVATGAAVKFHPATGYPTELIPPTGPDPQYDALRWLAQLAANIVDYLDSDDISTAFVWNPIRHTNPLDAENFATPTALSQRVVFGVEKPRLVLNEVYAEIANVPSQTTGDNPPTRPFQVRFFLELLNPGNDDPNPASPFGEATVGTVKYPSGSVPLQVYGDTAIVPYRVQVFQEDKGAVRNELDKPDNVTGAAPAAQRKIEIGLHALVASAGAAALAPTAYVEPNRGEAKADPTAAEPKNKRNGFAVVGPQFTAPKTPTDPALIPDPNAAPSATDPMPMTLGATGGSGVGLYYNDNDGTAPTDEATLVGKVGPNGSWNGPDYRHVVLLRRLANPYIPESPTNPYITVDYQSRVKVHDSVYKTTDASPGNPRPNPPGDAAKGNYRSAGRVQPYTGDESADVDRPYTETLTVQSQTDHGPGQRKHSFFQHNTVANLFGAPPSPDPTAADATLRFPFEWLVHLDRRLVNQAELLHVPAVRPHELTHRFAKPLANAANGPVHFHRHDLQHRQITDGNAMMPTVLDPAGPLYAANSPLYRALELLTVKPWTHGLPTGGRTPGKVNVNMIWDEYLLDPANPNTSRRSSRVLEALIDPQPGNAFNTNPNFASDLWEAIKQARHPGFQRNTPLAVRQTRDEAPANQAMPNANTLDRPFRAFGIGLFNGGNNLAGQQNTDTIGGLQDTLMRSQIDPNTGLPAQPEQPLFGNNTATHPYLQWEPLRKVLNNLTTVTDTYLVIYTVGYFEVREEEIDRTTGLTRRVLGAEAYDRVPGDLRSQYTAVIDRSKLAGPPADPTAQAGSAAARGVGAQPADGWFTELAVGPTLVDPAQPPANQRYFIRFPATGFDPTTGAEVRYETPAGQQPARIRVNDVIVLGVGQNREEVTVIDLPTSLAWTPPSGTPVTLTNPDPATGLVTAIISRPTRVHPAGEAVSGAVDNGMPTPMVPANPGPQLNFDLTSPRYRSVIPYHGRLLPGGP